MNRRYFLRNGALMMAGIGAAPLWLQRAVAAEPQKRTRKVLVAIFQRGAADGLNIVVPFREQAYYAMRPTIAVPAPLRGAEAGKAAIDLDGFFALHPALAAIKPVYDAGSLAIVHAAGSPNPSRSHFDAQDFMESGTPGVKSTEGGWLNRALDTKMTGVKPARDAEPSPLRAVALGATLPRTLRGKNSAVAVSNLNEFQIRDQAAAVPFESMYEQAAGGLGTTGKETFEALAMVASIRKRGYTPAAGAEYPRGPFGDSLRQIAQLIKADAGVEAAFTDVGGWDHHFNETGRDASEGQLANRLRDFGGALAAFWRDMGDRMGGCRGRDDVRVWQDGAGKRNAGDRSRAWECDVGYGRRSSGQQRFRRLAGARGGTALRGARLGCNDRFSGRACGVDPGPTWESGFEGHIPRLFRKAAWSTEKLS